jgi:hypothetical protein
LLPDWTRNHARRTRRHGHRDRPTRRGHAMGSICCARAVQ